MTQRRAHRRSAAGDAARRVRAVRDDPRGRFELAATVYASCDADAMRYGNAELAFLRWEIDRGVLAPLDADPPGSPWWRAVNEELLRDALEAFLICESDRPREPSAPSVERWLSFYEFPSARHWYRAHNASVANGYVRAVGLAEQECAAEHVVMQLTLARVLYAHALVADVALTGLDLFDRLGRWLVDPRHDGIGDLMRLDAFYPSRYPLDAEDDDDSPLQALQEAVVHLTDAIIVRVLSRLFIWSSIELGVPELGAFVSGDRVVYPVAR